MAIYLGNTKVNATAGTSATALITVDQSYDATSTNAQSGTAVAEAIEEITVDQTYSASSTNAQSGTAVASAVSELKVIVVTSSSFSSLPQTISNTKIKSNHVVVNSVLSNPSAQTGDWTVTTSNGSLTISGSISGSTTVTLYLLMQNPLA